MDDPKVKAAFAAFSEAEREHLLQLRALILSVAQETAGVGRIEETLKWGQPAYLTPDTKAGSTIRLGVPKTGGVAIYTHCQSSIMADFQAVAPDGLVFEGNRGVHLATDAPLPKDALALLIRGALTYHLRKRR
ncbi:MAG: DUF1801 domain-containing protein [Pseudomonadota bacterium]